MLSVQEFHANTTDFVTSNNFIMSLQNTNANIPLVETPAIIHMPKKALPDNKS